MIEGIYYVKESQILQQLNILFYCKNNPIEGCASKIAKSDKMSTPPDCTFPEATLREIAQLSGSPTPDFSSMDFVGEPWAWIEHLAKDKRGKSRGK